MLNDRETINIAKSQTGFMGFIIQPSYEAWVAFLPNVQINLDTMEANKPIWKSLEEQYEERKKKKEF